MQLVPVPLYDREMAVEAYLVRYQKGNGLFSTTQATGVFDGASRSQALETVNLIGLDSFTLGKPLFIPIGSIMLLGDLASQCTQNPEKVVFYLEEPPPNDDPYLSAMALLRDKGYRFAVSNLTQPNQHHELLGFTSYYFLSQSSEKKIAASERILFLLKKHYPEIAFVATGIGDQSMLKTLYDKKFSLFESRFYRVPVTQGPVEISPLKANSIRLINIVRDENFEFERVTEILRADPSLTISLLCMVNTPQYTKRGKIRTIAQAVAMLGQKEVRKWVTTAVSQSLGYDRPTEITRISLIRAKFAENLAPLFEMAHMAQEIYLMGLFSVLDVILEVPMAEALQMVLVSDMIGSALLEGNGLFYPLLNLITDYEAAEWSAVSRHMIIHDISEEDLHEAYIDAMVWYRDMTMVDVEELQDDFLNAELGEAEVIPMA